MTRWLLVRHGETEWNQAGRYQGHLDVALSERGRQQAGALGAALARETVSAAFSSDLSRARETAEIILQGRDVRLSPTTDLRETHYGQWEGLTFAQAREQDPDVFSRVLRWDRTISPPGGEGIDQVFARVKSFVSRVQQQGHDGTLLVVAHSGSVRMLASALLGLPPEATRRFALDNASLSIVEAHPQGSFVLLWNHTSHYRRPLSS